MYFESYYETTCVKPAKSNESVLRESVKFGLLSIVSREQEYVQETINEKKDYICSGKCKSFDEIVQMVDEIIELQQSISKIAELCETIQEV